VYPPLFGKVKKRKLIMKAEEIEVTSSKITKRAEDYPICYPQNN
jgi:hypothetical protein